MLQEMEKDKIIKVLCEDIASITNGAIQVLSQLESIKGKELLMVSDFIQQMKSANQVAIKEIERVARNTEKHS